MPAAWPSFAPRASRARAPRATHIAVGGCMETVLTIRVDHTGIRDGSMRFKTNDHLWFTFFMNALDTPEGSTAPECKTTPRIPPYDVGGGFTRMGEVFA